MRERLILVLTSLLLISCSTKPTVNKSDCEDEIFIAPLGHSNVRLIFLVYENRTRVPIPIISSKCDLNYRNYIISDETLDVVNQESNNNHKLDLSGHKIIVADVGIYKFNEERNSQSFFVTQFKPIPYDAKLPHWISVRQ